MEAFFPIFALNLAVLFALATAGWLVSLVRRNVTLADTLWGLGFVAVAWVTFATAEGWSGRRWLAAILTTFWGFRLAAYLEIRNRGKGEDPRYGKWRRAAGERFWIISLFKVFWLQALFLWVISLVVQFPQTAPQPTRWTFGDVFGTGLWLLGFVWESTADWQLYRFKADPANRGRVMERGLWRYSRHPNYFGEVLVWWGMFGISASVPWGLWTAVSPIVITYVLLKMTGVPLTEAALQQRRPEYRAYMERTPAVIPRFRQAAGGKTPANRKE